MAKRCAGRRPAHAVPLQSVLTLLAAGCIAFGIPLGRIVLQNARRHVPMRTDAEALWSGCGSSTRPRTPKGTQGISANETRDCCRGPSKRQDPFWAWRRRRPKGTPQPLQQYPGVQRQTHET